MTNYLIRRILLSIPVLLVITMLVYGFLQATGVDPVSVILGADYTPEQAAIVRRQLGLDQPVPIQYVIWLGRAVQGDLGRSFIYRQRVTVVIRDRLVNTVQLATAAMLFSLIIAIPAGIISAIKRNSLIDTLVRILAIVGLSIPVFWLGILLIVVFSLNLRLLPPGGSVHLYGLQALILPSIALGAGLAGITARLVRSSVLEVLRLEYVSTARAKGLAESQVISKHVLKNALLPVITMIGLQFGAILGGAVLTETVFSMPGLGRLLIESIHNRDYPVVQACILIITVAFLLINLFIDALYAFIDPRIRYT